MESYYSYRNIISNIHIRLIRSKFHFIWSKFHFIWSSSKLILSLLILRANFRIPGQTFFPPDPWIFYRLKENFLANFLKLDLNYILTYGYLLLVYWSILLTWIKCIFNQVASLPYHLTNNFLFKCNEIWYYFVYTL